MAGLPDPATEIELEALLSYSREELLRELVYTVQSICDLSARVGFLRAEEIRDPRSYAKSERVEREELRAAFNEKKWLIINLLER